MILVLSGEGPTDLGTRQLREAGWEFVPGPMAWIVDKLLGQPDKLNYSLLELHASKGDCVDFLNEGELAALRRSKPFFLPRGNDTPGNVSLRKGAFLLGKHAKGVASERNSPVIAVFFRDADGTNSTPRAEWEGKFTSMKQGFVRADFQSGVPMIPRPKSEAWMLCGLLKREDAGRNCSQLEEAPGNDASPKSLKTQLAKHLNCEPTAEQQAELVSCGQIDPALIDLSSFTAFCAELDRAYALAAQPLN
jgi:hypothetical protein